MVPIHDTDIAEERWLKADWENYELWEKIEITLRRRKVYWIIATALVFLLLSSVPVIRERMPKWRSMGLSRRLAAEISDLKLDASRDHKAYRLRFVGNGSLDYRIESAGSCSETSGWSLVRESTFSSPALGGRYRVMSPADGKRLGIPGLQESFCYDYLSGSDAILRDENVVGFGFGPVNDLTEERLDRSSILLLTGPSAEISFD